MAEEDLKDDSGGTGDEGGELDEDFERLLSEVEVDIDEFQKDDDDGEGKETKRENGGKGSKEGEEDPEELKSLKAELDKLRADKNDLKRALHEERQEKKRSRAGKDDDEAATLTDEQLKALLDEHRDDPGVLLNIVKYQAEKVAKGIKKDVKDEAEVEKNKSQIDAFMKSRYPDYDDEDSDLRKGLSKVKQGLGLDDNPYGDYFAAGVQVLNSLPDIVKHWYEEGKKAAMEEKTDGKRKESIKDSQLMPSGRKSDASIKDGGNGLSATQMETAQRLGFKTPQQLKLYRDQILRNQPARRKEG